jgi:competence protein ComGC
MRKRSDKILKRGFLVVLALVALLLFLISTPPLSNDIKYMKHTTNGVSKVINEDIYQFCLAVESETI